MKKVKLVIKKPEASKSTATVLREIWDDLMVDRGGVEATVEYWRNMLAHVIPGQLLLNSRHNVIDLEQEYSLDWMIDCVTGNTERRLTNIPIVVKTELDRPNGVSDEDIINSYRRFGGFSGLTYILRGPRMFDIRLFSQTVEHPEILYLARDVLKTGCIPIAQQLWRISHCVNIRCNSPIVVRSRKLHQRLNYVMRWSSTPNGYGFWSRARSVLWSIDNLMENGEW